MPACTQFAGTATIPSGLPYTACCCGIPGNCAYFGETRPGNITAFPSGQHRLHLSVDFGVPVVVGVYIDITNECLYNSGTAQLHHEFTVDYRGTGTQWVLCEQNVTPPVSFGYLVEYTNRSDEPACGPAAGFCAFGTQLKPGSQFVYYLTPGLIDAWLTSVGMIWLAPLFTALWFSTLNAQTLCGNAPPPLPPIGLQTLTAESSTILQILRSIAWQNVCQCAPGSPPPVPYPPPAGGPPVGWPPPQTFACNNLDLCATVGGMAQQLALLSGSVSAIRSQVDLLQRYKLPFAPVPGAVHSSLSGQGQFAISRLVGIRVNVLATPAGEKILPGSPPYYWDLGWMGVGEAGGFMQEKRIARLQFDWYPENAALATLFSFFLKPGVVASFTELGPEP